MKFLSLITSKTGMTRTLSSEASVEKGLSLKGVLQVLEHFSIGSRLQYYPEYRKETKIDTIIIAYVLNDFVIYSNKDIQITEAGGKSESVEVMQQGSPVPIARIYSFSVLIPNIDRKEIDFKRSGKNATDVVMPTEKVANDFKRGNSITLFCRNATSKGIPHIDTEVVKKIVFNSGMYAKRKLVMLEPLLGSFECVDLRRFNRINTEIPAEIYLEGKKMKGDCLLQDFSERFVRIEMTSASRLLLHTLEVGLQVVLRIVLPFGEQAMVLRGTVFKTRKKNIVISLQNLMKKGRFQQIDELDELFIKATMLEHPKTERN